MSNYLHLRGCNLLSFAAFRASPRLAFRTGYGLTGDNPLGSDFVVVLSNARQHVGHESPRRRGEIEAILQTDEIHFALLEIIKQRCQSAGGSSQAIQTPHHDLNDFAFVHWPNVLGHRVPILDDISDFEIAEAMLRYFIQKVNGNRWMVGPRVVISVPGGITEVEKRAVIDSADRAGARRTYLCEQPLAAAIGAGLPWTEPQASMIVDIGGGTSDIAILSLGDIAVCESLRVAGDDLDEAIISHMKKTYNLSIGEQTAERIKIEIGSAAPVKEVEDKTMDVRGRDMISGLPRKTVVTAEEIREALSEPVSAMAEAVTRTLEKAAPELSADLVENGLTIAGGGALLRGIGIVFQNATGLPVKIAEDPLTCVARGTAIFLENIELVKQTLENSLDS